jgi:hypothetical protein
VDVNDFSYTPGDNTFNGQRTGSALSDFYLGLESAFFQDNGRAVFFAGRSPQPLCAGRLEGQPSSDFESRSALGVVALRLSISTIR